MNNFPTLYQLALDVVVDSFTTGLLPTHHVILSPNVQEDVFEGAMRARDESFGKNWMKAVSSMFPNLEVLNICDRKMSESDFRRLCNKLPKLRFLNVSNTGIKSLCGISKLKNLEYLHIGSLEFETEEDVEEIFELKKLKQLVFGNYSEYAMNCDWFFEKPHPELTTLECQWEDADDDFLRRILPKLPKLKTIVAIVTEVTQDAVFPGITLYTAETVEEMMKSSEYLRSQGNRNGIMEVFRMFTDIWDPSEVGILWTPEQMKLVVNELEAVIRHFKLDKQNLPDVIEEFFEFLQINV